MLNLTLRPAHPVDAEIVASLIEMAGDGIPTRLWARAARPGERPIDCGARMVAAPAGWFSHAHITVAERDGRLVGMALRGCAGSIASASNLTVGKGPGSGGDILALDPALAEVHAALARMIPDSLHLAALATLPGNRGKGIGSALIEALSDEAARTGLTGLTTCVFAQNFSAFALYRRRGFVPRQHRTIAAHPCYPNGGEIVLMERGLKSLRSAA